MEKQILILIAIYFFAAGLAHAEKLDLSAHDSIIQKLESVANVTGEDAMVQTVAVDHRLADLYAERARLLSMEEEGKGATSYKEQIKTDRNKAITNLNKVLSRLPLPERGNALLQIAHLHELLSENEEALKIYQNIERNPKFYNSKTNAISEIKLGDYYFATVDLRASKKHFEKSLTYAENPRKAYSTYRLAWIHYNMGQSLIAEKQLVQILKTPSRELDPSFIEEVTHDLATFTARNDLKQTDLKTYIKLMPEYLRKKNLIYLAKELDRTAKKKNALKVWALIGTQKLSFEDQIERQIQMTQIAYDLGHYSSVNQEISKSIVLLKKSECQENPNCTLAKQNLRKVITDWGRAEERKASPELIAAFIKYTESFEDYEMNFWAAGLAAKQQNHQAAFDFYLKASTILKKTSSKNEQQKKLFELSLVGGIEMAGFAKNPNMKLIAFQRYLEFNPNGKQASEVKYQIARWYYDQDHYQKAREEFKILSLDEQMPVYLREKSADLCLDISALLKEDYRIEVDSFQLAQQIKGKRSEYLSIYRKSILNQTAETLNSKNEAPALEAELTKLNKIDHSSFVAYEKNQLLKNKMELAYRTKDLEQLAQNANELLRQKSLAKNDQQKAYQYLAWTFEVRMNFKESLAYLKLIQPAPRDLATYYLKLAMLKEFTSQNPTQDYERFISLSRDPHKIAFAAHQIVLAAGHPENTFNKYENILRKKQDLYASAALFTYEKNRNPGFAKRILSNVQFKKSDEALLLRHQESFTAFKILKTQLGRSTIKAGSDAVIRRALIRRNNLIQQAEKQANQAIAKKDTFEQLIYLSILAIENKKLAEEILALPQPLNLKKSESAQYEQQLKKMVSPYEVQSENINRKMQTLWKQAATIDLLENLSAWSTQIQRPGHELALQELSLLRSSVQSLGLTSSAFEKLSERRQKMSTEASSLQTKIFKSPFDFNYLEKMKSVQSSLGSGTMVAYLDSRIDELSSRGR